MKLKYFIRLEASMATELDKIFFGNKPCQMWTNAQSFEDHLRLHHSSPDDGGGDGLRNVGLLSITDTACCRDFMKLKYL
jgi:hypothetical protein